MQQIVVIGGLVFDITYDLPHWPQPYHAVHAESAVFSPGGKGLNTAVAARRLGADVVVVGCIGRDFLGEHMLATLQAEGITTDFVRRHASLPTGIVTMLLQDAKPGFIGAPGASKQVTEQDLAALHGIITADTVMVVNYEVNQPVVAAALDMARSAGATTLLNPAPPRGLMLDAVYLSQVDMLLPNLDEARIMLDRDSGLPEELAQAFLDRGVKQVCITLGDDGAFFSDGQTTIHQPVMDVPAIDTTGASDAFCGAFAVAVAEGQSHAASLRFAAAAAAHTCTQYGTMPAMPTREQVEALL